jgi:hypothetical protein
MLLDEMGSPSPGVFVCVAAKGLTVAGFGSVAIKALKVACFVAVATVPVSAESKELSRQLAFDDAKAEEIRFKGDARC